MPPVRELIALPTLFGNLTVAGILRVVWSSGKYICGWDGVSAVEQPEIEWHESIRRRCITSLTGKKIGVLL